MLPNQIVHSTTDFIHLIVNFQNVKLYGIWNRRKRAKKFFPRPR